MLLTLRKALHWGAFFVACSLGSAVWAECSPPGEGYAVRIDHVVDGDTVRLTNGESVRLIGVNTPEIGRRGKADEPGAKAAKYFLQTLVAGSSIQLVPGLERRDKYGRLLAHLVINGEPVAEQLLEQGLGFAVGIPPNLRLSDCLFDAERRARNQGAGLWRQTPVRAARAVAKGGFALVSGRVTKVDQARNAVYVELDDHLVLKVSSTTLLAGAEWRRLMGKEVEARGWVIDRGRLSKPGRKRWLIDVSDRRHLRIGPN